MADSNPFGLHTITPCLIVPRVPQLVAFLTELFGASQRGEMHMRDDGSVQHAEVLIGDYLVMMGEPTSAFPAAPCTLYTYVAHCDDTDAKALTMEATSVLEPADYPHGDRYRGIRDLSGNSWWIVTHKGK